MHPPSTLPPEGRLFMSPQEVAAALGTDPRTIRRAIAEGQIPGFKVGVNWKIPAAWLREAATGGGSNGTAA